jgi:hypothetical protein
MKKGGNRHVVGQVRDQRGRLLGQVARLQIQHVVMKHGEPVDLAVRVLGDGVRQLACQHRVDLHGGDLGTAVQQRECQRAETGPDLQDVVLTVDSGCRNHTAHGVCVVNEILAVGLTRPEIQLFGEVPNFSTAQQSDGQDAPALPLHTGHAPQP